MTPNDLCENPIDSIFYAALYFWSQASDPELRPNPEPLGARGTTHCRHITHCRGLCCWPPWFWWRCPHAQYRTGSRSSPCSGQCGTFQQRIPRTSCSQRRSRIQASTLKTGNNAGLCKCVGVLCCYQQRSAWFLCFHQQFRQRSCKTQVKKTFCFQLFASPIRDSLVHLDS